MLDFWMIKKVTYITTLLSTANGDWSDSTVIVPKKGNRSSILERLEEVKKGKKWLLRF